MSGPIFPKKLQPGSEIRVIAPSFTASVFPAVVIESAKEYLTSLGFKISYSKHLFGANSANFASIEDRISDLHEAFSDNSVDGILTVTGGFNVNQLLNYVDYDLIYKKSGLVTYSGPNFSVFGLSFGDLRDKLGAQFLACVSERKGFEMSAPESYIDHPWKGSDRIPFGKPVAINFGRASGSIIGGNLCTLNLLQGTTFMPSLKDSVLFLEDDSDSSLYTFDRDLQSLLHLAEFAGVQGIVLGKFQAGSKISDQALIASIRGKRELSAIPVLANINFGHTFPMATFPIGGQAEIVSEAGETRVKILDH
jgi:muramoyltetrapeptide carboxypeptidase